MTDDLVAFLRARLDEDEQTARAAGGGKIEAVEYLWETKYLNVRRPDGAVTQTTEFSAELADHIARHDPARVLAEVGAKRRIIAIYASWEVLAREDWRVEVTRLALYETLRATALPYADHPDYRPEWAPEA